MGVFAAARLVVRGDECGPGDGEWELPGAPAVDPDSAVSADASADPANAAAPIPRATANPPTRPTNRAASTVFPLACRYRLRRDGIAEVGKDTEFGRADDSDTQSRSHLCVHQFPVIAGEDAVVEV